MEKERKEGKKSGKGRKGGEREWNIRFFGCREMSGNE